MFALTGSGDETLKLWHLHSGVLKLNLTGHSAAVKTATFSSCDNFVLSGGWDMKAILWTVADGRKLMVYKGMTEPIMSVRFGSK